MCEEFSPHVPVYRLLECSGFGDSFSQVYGAASNTIHWVIFLGSSLIYNDAAVCGGRIDLKVVGRDLSERWKSLKRES